MAVAVGEQPIKGLVSPQAQARMTVCEALSNLSFAALSRYPSVSYQFAFYVLIVPVVAQHLRRESLGQLDVGRQAASRGRPHVYLLRRSV